MIKPLTGILGKPAAKITIPLGEYVALCKKADRIENLELVLELELCEWMRKEGYSNDFAQMKKQDILDALKRHD